MGIDGAVRKCLIVDDSEVIRRVARRIIEGLNFAVEEAGDGRQALDRCCGAMPEAILLDWSMPHMDGLEFLRTLRAQRNGDQPVVVFCSSENDPAEIAEAIRSGANEFIMKPFDSDIVTSKFADAGLI